MYVVQLRLISLNLEFTSSKIGYNPSRSLRPSFFLFLNQWFILIIAEFMKRWCKCSHTKRLLNCLNLVSEPQFVPSWYHVKWPYMVLIMDLCTARWVPWRCSSRVSCDYVQKDRHLSHHARQWRIYINKFRMRSPGPIFFIFKQFSGKFGQIIGSLVLAPL